MNAKAKQTLTGEPTSLKDAGYRIARNGDDARNMAAYVYTACPEFIDNPPEEIVWIAVNTLAWLRKAIFE